jgi:hypothetical protein
MSTLGGGNDDTKVQGKYLLIEVPDYDPADAATNKNRTSYLRLGMPNTEWRNESGADLALMAYLAGAAGRVADNSLTAKLSDGSSVAILDVVKSKNPAQLDEAEVADYKVNHPFIDDARRRGTGNVSPAGPPGHGLPVKSDNPTDTSRRTVSADLHAKCGWRDHCDGNRITTTYGDKVEVVWGNYKMIVMGRQWDPGQAMGWEASGNNVQDYAGAMMPGASVTVDWIATAYVPEGPLPKKVEFVPDPTKPNVKEEAEITGGAWLLQNSTENVWQYSRNAGNFKTENWGDLIENYTGSENPKRISTTVTDGMQGHPTQHTQATLPEGTTPRPETAVPVPPVKSVGLPRGNPHIIEKTWAIKMESYTGSAAWRIPSIHDETWAVTTSEVSNVSGNVTSATKVGGDVSETTEVSGSTSSSTSVSGDTSDSTSVSGSTSETTNVSGDIFSSTTAGSMTEITTCPNMSAVTSSVSIKDLQMAANIAELFIGTKASMALGASGELFAGLKVSINLLLAFEMFIGGKLDITIGKKKELGTDKTNAYIKNKVIAAKTAIVGIVSLGDLLEGIDFTGAI